MRVDRDAAAIVAHRDPAVGRELQLDSGRMAGNGLVHCIVERLGGEMVDRPLVGAADIHAGAPPDRFEALQDLDVLGGIALGRLGCQTVEQVGHGVNL